MVKAPSSAQKKRTGRPHQKLSDVLTSRQNYSLLMVAVVPSSFVRFAVNFSL
jgi:hypothetical protein